MIKLLLRLLTNRFLLIELKERDELLCGFMLSDKERAHELHVINYYIVPEINRRGIGGGSSS